MMNKVEILRKVGAILGELNDQYEYISEKPENLNELELELFSANAEFLAEHVKVLRKLNAIKAAKPAALPMVSAMSQELETEALTVKEEERESPEHKAPIADIFVPDRTAPEEKTELSSTAQVSRPIAEVTSVPVFPPSRPEEKKPEFRPEPVVVREEPVIVKEEPVFAEPARPANDFFKDRTTESYNPVKKPSLNDLISEQRAQAQAAAPSVSPNHNSVTDLKSLINLNDKLLFIKELFNGYSLAYSEAIEILNRFGTLEEADHFLKANYAEKNNWVAREATVEKFYSVLNKKFSR